MERKKQIPILPPKRFLSFEVVLLVVVTVAVYFGTLDNTFHFDDKQNVWNNSSIQVSRERL